MTEVIMPKMGDGMEEGTLVEWLKKPGEKVKSGEVIGTIQTDKATLELEAPASGKLDGILLAEGETVPVGRPIAVILKDGESVPGNWASGGSGASSQASAAPVAETTSSGASGSASSSNGQGSTGSSANARVKASPLAKKIAASKGIDLTTVTGSGPGGRIVERDLESAAPAVPAAKTPAPAAPIVQVSKEDQLVPISRVRAITGQRTLQSKTQVPHFYVTVKVDVENILALRKMFDAEGTAKPSINDFVIRASALALREMPAANATFTDKGILQFGAINIGIATALPDGLTVPVLKNADAMPLTAISAAAKALVSKARDNKLGMDELTGSTFSISNMGMFNVDNFIAIINQPNAAIIAVSSAEKEVTVAADGSFVARTRMNVTGSFDHRVLDGASGAAFMNVLRGLLENPTRLLS